MREVGPRLDGLFKDDSEVNNPAMNKNLQKEDGDRRRGQSLEYILISKSKEKGNKKERVNSAILLQ